MIETCTNCQENITCIKYKRWGHSECNAHSIGWGAYEGKWCHNCTIAYYEIMENIFKVKIKKKENFIKMRRFKYNLGKVVESKGMFGVKK